MSLNSHIEKSNRHETENPAPKLCVHKVFHKRKEKNWGAPEKSLCHCNKSFGDILISMVMKNRHLQAEFTSLFSNLSFQASEEEFQTQT